MVRSVRGLVLLLAPALAAMLVGVPLAGAAPGADAGRRPTQILFHADLDGDFAVPRCQDPFGKGHPDFAGLVAVLRSAAARAQAQGRPRPIALLGGNIVAPGLLARGVLKREATAGAEALAELLSEAGYAAVGLGHHDLSLERQRLERFLSALRGRGIPIVATNFSCDGDRTTLCGSLVKEAVLEGAAGKLAVLATVSPLVLPGIPRENREGLTLEPPLSAVRAAVTRLRARGVARVVLLTQGPRTQAGLEETLTLQRELASGRGPEPGPDVILAGGLGDGRSGGTSPVRLLRRDGAPSVVGSGEGAASVALVDLEGPGRLGVEVLPVAGTTDPRVAALLRPQVETYCSRYGGPVGPGLVSRPLQRDEWIGYVLSVMRRRARAEIALLNRDFVKRLPFPIVGTLRLADLLRAMPYHGSLGRGRMTGADLLASVAPALGRPDGQLVAVGMERAADGTITVNGRPVDRARTYSIASIPFVAQGGDDLLAPGALTLSSVDDGPDVRDLVQLFLERETAAADGDPRIDPASDFGPPASARPLLVGLADLTLDLAETSIRRQPGYGAPQLTRAEQRSVKGDLTVLGQLRARLHEGDARLKLLYGWARNRPAGEPAVSAETADLLSLSTLYNFRGLRDLRAPVPRAAVPDPYARLLLESELTRPEATIRDYRHAELTATVGVLFTVTPKLRLRGGPGLRKQLVAPTELGRARPLVEAGGSLDPVVLASFGRLSARFEALADYVFVDPWRSREHQLKATARLSFPLLPMLYLTTGVDLFGTQLQGQGWGMAADTTIGLRLHVDAARQLL